MKIVMVVDGMGIGGIERVCVDYTKLLLELGNEVTLVNLNPKQTTLEKDLPCGVNIFHFSFPRKLSGEQYAQLTKRSWWGRYIYPLVYTVLRILNLFLVIKSRIKLKLKPDLLIAFSGHFNDLTFVADNFLSSKKKLAWMHGAYYSYLLISDGFFNLYKKIRNLVCLVDDGQEEALMYNKNRQIKIYKLYNPTNIISREIDFAKVAELKKKYGKFILMVSRFEYPHKDHYTVCDSLEILRKKYHNNINLLLIGDGPSKEKVRNYVKDKGSDISKHIYFLGTKTDVQNYYKAAFALVHASVAGEGLPTVQLEALSCGLPQVVTDSKVGPREILGDNKYGLLCKVQDPGDMAEKVKMLLDNKNLYLHYKEISRQRLQDFLPSEVRKRLSIILQRVMEN